MLNDIQITSDYMSRWVVLKRKVGAVTSQRVLKVFFYVNILQCFFVVENFTVSRESNGVRGETYLPLCKNGENFKSHNLAYLSIFLLSTDCLVLYVTWRPFVFLNQFDLKIIALLKF
jgi:hypothetical protein